MTSTEIERQQIQRLFDLCIENANHPMSAELFSKLVAANLEGTELARSIPWNQLNYTLFKLNELSQHLPKTEHEIFILKRELNRSVLPAMAIASNELHDEKTFHQLLLNLTKAHKIDGLSLTSAEVQQVLIKRTNLKKKIQQKVSEISSKVDFSKLIDMEDVQEKLVNNLSQPVANSLRGTQPPFQYDKEDAPQVAAIKECLNALYQIDKAGKQWNQGGLSSVLAFYSIYQAYKHLNNAGPEVQQVMNNNIELFKPIMSAVSNFVGQYSGNLNELDRDSIAYGLGEKAGSLIDYLGQENDKPASIAEVAINIGNELPMLINLVRKARTGDDIEVIQDKILNDRQVAILGKNIDALVKLGSDQQHRGSLNALNIKHFDAMIRLRDILYDLTDESLEMNQQAMEKLIDWYETSLPEVLIWIDGLENELYLKHGAVSKTIKDSLLNKDAEYRELASFGEILNYSPILAKRIQASEERKLSLIQEELELEGKKERLRELFDKLEKGVGWQGHNIESLESSLRKELRDLYPLIQPYLIFDSGQEQAFVEALNKPDIPWYSKLIGTLLGNPDGIRIGEVGLILEVKHELLEDYDKHIRRVHLKQAVEEQSRHDLIADYKGKLTVIEDPESDEFYRERLVQEYRELDSSKEKMIQFLHQARQLQGEKLAKQEKYDLRQKFKQIQQFIHHMDPDIEAQFVAALNSKDANQLKRLSSDLLASKQVEDFHERRSIELADNADMIPVYEPEAIAEGELKSWEYSESNSVLSYLEQLQELKISGQISQAKSMLEYYRNNYLSKHAQANFEDSFDKKKQQYNLSEDEPDIVRKIKTIENSLITIQHLLEALEGVNLKTLSFEDMVSVAKQMPQIYQLSKNLWQLKNELSDLPAEVKEHIKPLFDELSWITASQPAMSSPAQKTKQTTVEQLSNIVVDGLNYASHSLENSERQIKNRFNLREEMSKADESGPRSEPVKYEHIREQLTGSTTEKLKGLKQLYIVVDELYQQALTVGSDVNRAFTEHPDEVQRDLFNAVLTPISNYEDTLCLEAGTLLLPALEELNKIYLSLIAEMDNMDFSDKMKVLDDTLMFDAMIEQVEKRRVILHDQLNTTSSPSEQQNMQLKLEVLESKITFLKEQKLLRMDQIQRLQEQQKQLEIERESAARQLAIEKERQRELDALLERDPDQKVAAQEEVSELQQRVKSAEEVLAGIKDKQEQLSKDSDTDQSDKGLSPHQQKKLAQLRERQIQSHLRKEANKNKLDSPIKEQYVKDLEAFIKSTKREITPDELQSYLNRMTMKYNVRHLHKYQYVNESYKLFKPMENYFEGKNENHHAYLARINSTLANDKTSIDDKCKLLVSESREKSFKRVMKAAPNGASVLSRFIYLTKNLLSFAKDMYQEPGLGAVSSLIRSYEKQPDFRKKQKQFRKGTKGMRKEIDHDMKGDKLPRIPPVR